MRGVACRTRRPTIASQEGHGVLNLGSVDAVDTSTALHYSLPVESRTGDLLITSRNFTASYSLYQHRWPRGWSHHAPCSPPIVSISHHEPHHAPRCGRRQSLTARGFIGSATSAHATVQRPGCQRRLEHRSSVNAPCPNVGTVPMTGPPSTRRRAVRPLPLHAFRFPSVALCAAEFPPR